MSVKRKRDIKVNERKNTTGRMKNEKSADIDGLQAKMVKE